MLPCVSMTSARALTIIVPSGFLIFALMKTTMCLKVTPFIICLLLAAQVCSAQTRKEDEIDIAYFHCLDQDTSSGNIGGCAFIAYGKWEKEMKDTYSKLMRELKKKDEKDALQQSQKAWEAYRDATFLSYDMMFDKPGSQWCLLRHNDRIDMVRSRALQLRSYYQSLKKRG